MDKLETRIKTILAIAACPMTITMMAEHIGKGRGHVRRLLHPDISCRLTSYAQALNALGYEMEITAHGKRRRRGADITTAGDSEIAYGTAPFKPM